MSTDRFRRCTSNFFWRNDGIAKGEAIPPRNIKEMSRGKLRKIWDVLPEVQSNHVRVLAQPSDRDFLPLPSDDYSISLFRRKSTPTFRRNTFNSYFLLFRRYTSNSHFGRNYLPKNISSFSRRRASCSSSIFLRNQYTARIVRITRIPQEIGLSIFRLSFSFLYT